MADASQHRAWAHPTRARYFQVHLDRDLLGYWTLREVWGGIDPSGGRMHNTAVSFYDEGAEQIRSIAKRRGCGRRVGFQSGDSFSSTSPKLSLECPQELANRQ